jgi:hypothetical protein
MAHSEVFLFVYQADLNVEAALSTLYIFEVQQSVFWMRPLISSPDNFLGNWLYLFIDSTYSYAGKLSNSSSTSAETTVFVPSNRSI